MFVGIIVYKESINRRQIIAVLLLFSGILLFFNRELPHLLSKDMRNQLIGILLSLIASAVWVVYSLVQK